MKSKFPEGFFIGGAHAGLKKTGKDVGLIYCPEGFFAAACFTKNRFPAAPVVISRKHLPRGKVLVVNSRFANAGTGARGIKDAMDVCGFAAREFGVAKNEVLLASTGVIGRPLPVEKIKKGIKKISRSFAGKPEDAVSFAESILTTDTRRKICATDDFWACAKGSGMIAPDMATFLCFILTDACVPPVLMKRVLSESIRPFNTMTVDGEMSTNDSVFLLSTGKRKITPLKFGEGLNGVCRVLSEKIIADGEGATKVITVSVKSARNRKDARFLARFLANSPLIKTAFNGESPNWGRIFSRVGASGVAVNEKRMSISICGVSVFRGAPVKFDGLSLERQLMRKNVSFEVDISMGKERCSFRTTDLSAEYVKINAGYAT